MADRRQATNLTTWAYGVDYFLGESFGPTTETKPLRTVYNARTGQYEEIPLPEFQRLLRQGRIEESETQSPYDGHAQRTHRLI